MSYPGDNPPPSSPPPASINDTTEVPYAQPAPPSQPAPPPPKKKRNGCLMGCLVFFLIAVILAVVSGLMAKNAWDDFWSDDEATTTTTANPNAKQVDVVAYQAIITGHLTSLSTGVDAVGESCQDINNVEPCRVAVRGFRTELVATQSDLNGVKPPAEFAKSDAEFRAALNEAIKGTDDVLAGLDGNPLKLARGVVTVGKAGAKLEQAGMQLTEDASAAATPSG